MDTEHKLLSTLPEKVAIGIIAVTIILLDLAKAISVFGTAWLIIIGWIIGGIILFDFILFGGYISAVVIIDRRARKG